MTTMLNVAESLKTVRGVIVRRRAVTQPVVLDILSQLATAHPLAPARQFVQAAAKAITAHEGEPMTLADALIDALLSSRSALECNGKEKLRRFRLARQIEAALEADPLHTCVLASDDVDFLDTCAGEHFAPAVYGVVHEHLYPTAKTAVSVVHNAHT